ncbi:Lcl domain-containing protein [Thiothrix subterranea]|uniref:DUF1566 domain-containing protein n=1 Tax=Thiothrix subterranea TaxID=2735563 RepID=A0AA51MLH4_9GAMM|nr:DUF1566 domain-containing protein [Thiothrix subterranea]MDQ5768926.1 DUF1566 domain-containing protein [Thiothrix subterranea]QQZ27726.1 DUF1566 domain-containing protein [Thiothrix subterranea]WML86158.1 DUF1566 domain-containing protein [Thiothrix subterranea]
MHDIFLSYSSQDRERLQPLFQALAQQSWSVFWDHQSIHTGENWHRKIDQAIRESRCVVVVWSKGSVDSEWVLEEASNGKSRNVLLPIKIDDIEPPFGFAMRQAGNFTRWNGKSDSPVFIELAAQIYGLLGRGSQPLSSPPPKKFPWLPSLFLFAAVLGCGGYYWKYSVGASLAGDSSMQQGKPVKKESLAGQAPTAIPQTVASSHYIIHNDGTVTDTKSGLMWKQCIEGQSGVDCSTGEAAKYKWDDAMSEFESGVSFADYSDWRMPTKDELRTLVYCSNGIPQSTAWYKTCGHNYQIPTIDLQVFPNTPAFGLLHWSSKAKDASYAWGVNFYDGNDLWFDRYDGNHVRLVRSGQ